MRIDTKRLILRPFDPDDAATVTSLAGNWKVARMVAVIPHPYPASLAAEWIAGHAAARERGTHYSFAITLDSAVVGAIGLTRADSGRYALGYWIGEPWWGQGIATEAAQAIIRFARDTLGLTELEATFLDVNPASGRVLAKCGFVRTGETMQWREAWQQMLKCQRLRLELGKAARP